VIVIVIVVVVVVVVVFVVVLFAYGDLSMNLRFFVAALEWNRNNAWAITT
jgi:hypothetical protein